jgi:ribosomal protein S18 acetylase RimI-like enzyme
MDIRIRSARLDDVAPISMWTSDTFSWGDYVPERLPQWLDSPDSRVLVCIDSSDTPIALAHVALLSPTEAWIEAARVRPDHRRKRLGSALNDAGAEWAARRGARVIRLATEADNLAARSQVEGLGYRLVSSWVYAGLRIDSNHRAADHLRLRPAPGSDAEAAWLFWVASDLAREARELIAIGWRWRTARPEDVTKAVVAGEFLQSPAGWVSVDQPEEDWMRTRWIATTPDDLLGLVDGLRHLAAERGVVELDIKLPNLGWTAEALIRAGGDPSEVLVYAKALHDGIYLRVNTGEGLK